MTQYRMICPCLFGLESVLAGELKRMGAQNVAAQNGKVCFSGDAYLLARANLGLRTAERVLIELRLPFCQGHSGISYIFNSFSRASAPSLLKILSDRATHFL